MYVRVQFLCFKKKAVSSSNFYDDEKISDNELLTGSFKVFQDDLSAINYITLTIHVQLKSIHFTVGTHTNVTSSFFLVNTANL